MSINRHDPTPLYIQVAMDIKKGILSGEYESGNKIPSERELVQLYHVSRNTIRQGLKMLNHEGLAISNHGSGTYVANMSDMINSRLDIFVEHSQFIQTAGYSAKYQVLSQSVIPADEQICRILETKIGEPVFCFEKLFFADEKPAIFTIDYVPCGEKKNQKNFSEEEICSNFLSFVESCTGDVVEYGKSNLTPITADSRIAVLFDISIGQPILFMSEVFLNPLRNKPLSLGLNYYSNYIQFKILRRRSEIVNENYG